jgi:hypothetical protein
LADLKKAGPLAVGAALGVGVVTILAGLNGPSREPERGNHLISAGGSLAQTEQLVGKPFAESLDLPVITDFPGGCWAVAEAPPDMTMYCLDSVVKDEHEAKLIGMRVNGDLPTQLDEQQVALEIELESLGHTAEDEARRLEIINQISDLMAQIEAERDG